MRINNPMLGMTDFSTIPSYFIDQASLLHGTSSVNETGGGLGGLVKLGTAPEVAEGFNAQYVQGIGSFKPFDEFARFTYGSERWHVSTRAVYSSSPNDYKYTNHDKKINIYDEDKNIVGQYHPKERNRSGAFKDLHLLQEVYYNTGKGDRFGLNAWYINSNRELPMLTTDYGDATDFENRQREQTFRSVLSWDHMKSNWKLGVKGGYIHTWMAYDYKREVAPDNWASMTRSRSKVNTFYGQAEGEYSLDKKWFFTANVSAHQHLVRSEDKNIILQDGGKAIVGYDKGRVELSGSVSAKWQPIDRLGMSVVLREEMYGSDWIPLIPAFFIDGIISPKGNVMLKASISRNYRFPTLNDLYFLPGGNPNLKNEQGFSYDAGVSFDVGKKGIYKLSGGANWFDSYIDDWIIWLPTTKGFFSPRNVKKVHAYGVEVKANFAVQPAKDWLIDLNGSYSWTPSINEGEKMSPADQSVGKQLPYVHPGGQIGGLADGVGGGGDVFQGPEGPSGDPVPPHRGQQKEQGEGHRGHPQQGGHALGPCRHLQQAPDPQALLPASGHPEVQDIVLPGVGVHQSGQAVVKGLRRGKGHRHLPGQQGFVLAVHQGIDSILIELEPLPHLGPPVHKGHLPQVLPHRLVQLLHGALGVHRTADQPEKDQHQAGHQTHQQQIPEGNLDLDAALSHRVPPFGAAGSRMAQPIPRTVWISFSSRPPSIFFRRRLR